MTNRHAKRRRSLTAEQPAQCSGPLVGAGVGDVVDAPMAFLEDKRICQLLAGSVDPPEPCGDAGLGAGGRYDGYPEIVEARFLGVGKGISVDRRGFVSLGGGRFVGVEGVQERGGEESSSRFLVAHYAGSRSIDRRGVGGIDLADHGVGRLDRESHIRGEAEGERKSQNGWSHWGSLKAWPPNISQLTADLSRGRGENRRPPCGE